ncbi:MAG TPA: response regulator [Nitrososphaeraceae archaeon]|nr:response regulator [Nitrososphaeraceae archaeon]
MYVNQLINRYTTSPKKQRILVIDDEPDVNFTIKLALENEVFEVDTFDNPQLALSNFKPKFYDLILLDIKMPKIDGFEFYTEVKKKDNKVKVCFLTASEYTHYEQFLKENPKITVKCFARKPIPIGDLAKVVKEQLA